MPWASTTGACWTPSFARPSMSSCFSSRGRTASFAPRFKAQLSRSQILIDQSSRRNTFHVGEDAVPGKGVEGWLAGLRRFTQMAAFALGAGGKPALHYLEDGRLRFCGANKSRGAQGLGFGGRSSRGKAAHQGPAWVKHLQLA